MTAQPEVNIDDESGSRPMRADARRNYERLVEAARKVFADQGGGASMEAIAKQAGVGVGTLYRHFPKRIDLVEAVYREDVDVLVGSADRGLTELDPWAGLEAWLRAYVDYGRAKRTFLNELHEAFEKNPGSEAGVARSHLGRLRPGVDPGPGGGAGPFGHRRPGPDAAGVADVHEQHAHPRARRAPAGDGVRRPSPPRRLGRRSSSDQLPGGIGLRPHDLRAGLVDRLARIDVRSSRPAGRHAGASAGGGAPLDLGTFH